MTETTSNKFAIWISKAFLPGKNLTGTSALLRVILINHPMCHLEAILSFPKMHLFRRLCVLATYLCSAATGQKLSQIARGDFACPPIPFVAKRGIFSTIGICSGLACSNLFSTTESVSVSSPSKTSPSTPGSRKSATMSIPTSENPASTSISESSLSSTQAGYVLALTTTFTQPPACTGGITQVAASGTALWQDVIDPEVNSAYTSCLPSQFYSSILATTSLPPFDGLICPYNWETYNLTSTYVICCPWHVNISI